MSGLGWRLRSTGFGKVAILASIVSCAAAGLEAQAVDLSFPYPTAEVCQKKEEVVKEVRGRYKQEYESGSAFSALFWKSKERDMRIYYANKEAFYEACSRSFNEGCAQYKLVSPGPEWATANQLSGAPEGIRSRNGTPCVDTWFRLAARKALSGYVYFDTYRTDRRMPVDRQPFFPLSMVIDCRASTLKIADTWVPIMKGSLAWQASQLFC